MAYSTGSASHSSRSSGDGVVARIGLAAPLSGRAAALGREMVQAAQLAIAEANAAEPPPAKPGLRFEALPLDDRGTSTDGMVLARRLIATEGMLGMIGHYNSNVHLAVAPLYEDAGLPHITPIVSNPGLTAAGWQSAFRFTNSDDATARAIAAHLVREYGKKRAVVVTTKTTYGNSMGREFREAFTALGGSILAQQMVEEGVTDFQSLVKACPQEMDLVFYGGTYEGAPLVKELRHQGRSQLVATGDGCWDVVNFLQPAGAAAMADEGVLVLSACPEIGYVPGASDFAERYAGRYGPVINYAVNCYDATRVLIDAINRAATGKLSRRAVFDALRETHYQGIAYPKPTVFDAKGNNMAAVTALHVVRDGRFQQVAVYER